MTYGNGGRLKLLYNGIMSGLLPISHFHLSNHALLEMTRRQIVEKEVSRVLASPGQIELIRPGRAIYQSKIKTGKPSKVYLLRVFVDIDRDPPEVVTVYRTSKIEKYWRQV